MNRSILTKYLLLSIIFVFIFGMIKSPFNYSWLSAEDNDNNNDNSEYKEKNYKSYSDYLVQHPLNYGIIESIDQSFPLGDLDNYDGSIDQQ